MPIAACLDATFLGNVTISGTLTISSSVWSVNYDATTETEIHVPRACYENKACTEIYPNPRVTEALSEVDGVCVVTEDAPSAHREDTAEITIGEFKIVDQVQRETEFCREGDRLRFKALSDNPFAFAYTLERR